MQEIRSQFPALLQKVNGHDLVYLDSAATTLKPKSVIERISKYYAFENSNVHRGAHFLADQATRHFEESRQLCADFLGARSAEEIIFTKGTTDSLNLVAQSYAAHFLKEGDEILLTQMEHHANLVPWQMLAQSKNLKIQFVKLTPSGELDLEDFQKKLSARTKIFSVTGCSNTLGTVNPIAKMIPAAKKVGAIVVVDAAQWILHEKMQVEKLDIDFLAFSAHKIFGPTGLGILYGKKSLLDQMPPIQGGGSMISNVTFDRATFNEVPFKFEAGTPHIAGAIGLGEALKFFSALDFDLVKKQKQNLLKLATEKLKSIPGVRIIGEAQVKSPILSFVLDKAHASDVGQILDQQGVAVRTGHHCTQPLMGLFGITGTVRASFSIYNQEQDVEVLAAAVLKAKELLQ